MSMAQNTHLTGLSFMFPGVDADTDAPRLPDAPN